MLKIISHKGAFHMNQPKISKVLLIGINAKYIHSNPAVYSLKAYADKYYPARPGGCSLEIAEYTDRKSVV